MVYIGNENDSQGQNAQEGFNYDALGLEGGIENLSVGKADGLADKVAAKTQSRE